MNVGQKNMELVLIRHGDPDYANDTLTSKGHEEARLLADYLSDLPVEIICGFSYKSNGLFHDAERAFRSLRQDAG